MAREETVQNARLNDHSKRIIQTEIHMTEIKVNIKYTKEKVDKIEKKLEEFIDCADRKYASKLVEKIVYTIVGLIAVTVMLALINLIIIS